MALVTQSRAQGRILKVSNISGKTLAIGGKALRPGQTVDLRLASVLPPDVLNVYDDLSAQVIKDYFVELTKYLRAGYVTASIDGINLLDGDAENLDYPKDGGVWLEREIWTALAAADPNAIKLVFPALAAAYVYTASNNDFDGVVGPGTLVPPRNFSCTQTAGAGEALLAKNIVVAGLDLDGTEQVETIALTGVAAFGTVTDSGLIAWSKILTVAVPGDASPARGSYQFGFGNGVGFSATFSQGRPIREVMDNAIVAPGAITLSPLSPPNGIYIPSTVPNSVHTYMVVYCSD